MRSFTIHLAIVPLLACLAFVGCGNQDEVGGSTGSSTGASGSGSSGSSGSTGSGVPLSALGTACDDSHPCTDGAVCGKCGIATGQCTVLCQHDGYGADAGCPDNSFCSLAWTGSSVHVCVRLCQYDADCRAPTLNDGLSCNDAYSDGDLPSNVPICNVSNSIGSQNVCP